MLSERPGPNHRSVAMPNCIFVKTEIEGIVRCSVCGQEMKTDSPPEKCFASCAAEQKTMTIGTRFLRLCGCQKLKACWQPIVNEFDRCGIAAWESSGATRRFENAADQEKIDRSGFSVPAMIRRAIKRHKESIVTVEPIKKQTVQGQDFREQWYSLKIPPPLPTPIERGIVLAGGGWKFFASLYVSVKMIRDTGCSLPIQVWYLGDDEEFHPLMAETLPDVEWVDGCQFVRDHGLTMKQLGGWELKAVAALGCPFEKFAFFDADAYPVYDPNLFFESRPFIRHGAMFFSDMRGQKLEPGQWGRFGLGYIDEQAWESGQFMVDKSRHWESLYRAWWLNAHSPYVYQHIYGDKDTFHLAWRKSQAPVWVSDPPGWSHSCFLHRDHGGKTCVIHRTRDKFRFRWMRDSYMTPQKSVNRKVPNAPKEDIAHRYLAECLEKLPRQKVLGAMPTGLLIAGPPRSFTTETYRILRQAIRRHPDGVEAGEVLNHSHNPNAPSRHFSQDTPVIEKCCKILDNHRGEIIKDVAQPYAVKSYLDRHPGRFKVLHIHRNPEHVRRHQKRVWGDDNKPDPADWEQFYIDLADEVIEFEDVIRDPAVLWDAVERMGFRPKRFDYIDENFKRKRAATMKFVESAA